MWISYSPDGGHGDVSSPVSDFRLHRHSRTENLCEKNRFRKMGHCLFTGKCRFPGKLCPFESVLYGVLLGGFQCPGACLDQHSRLVRMEIQYGRILQNFHIFQILLKGIYFSKKSIKQSSNSFLDSNFIPFILQEFVCKIPFFLLWRNLVSET